MHLDGYFIERSGTLFKLPKGTEHSQYAGYDHSARIRHFSDDVFAVESEKPLTKKQHAAILGVYKPAHVVTIAIGKSISERIPWRRKVSKGELLALLGGEV